MPVGLAPLFPSDLVQVYSPLLGIRSADQQLLVVLKAKWELRGDQAFFPLWFANFGELSLNI